jgi:hypothetical protein
MRAEHHDTAPAVAAVFGFVFLILAGVVYGFHSLMQPTILKYRGISYASSPPTNAPQDEYSLPPSTSAPQSETRREQAPRQERQVRTRATPARNAGPSYGAPL